LIIEFDGVLPVRISFVLRLIVTGVIFSRELIRRGSVKTESAGGTGRAIVWHRGATVHGGNRTLMVRTGQRRKSLCSLNEIDQRLERVNRWSALVRRLTSITSLLRNDSPAVSRD